MHEHCKIMQRPDGRWVIVYGSETVKDGKEAKDAVDYGTAEETVAALRDGTSSEGERLQDTSYDNYLMEDAPEEHYGQVEPGMFGQSTLVSIIFALLHHLEQMSGGKRGMLSMPENKSKEGDYK